ncbi:hypothetical protein, partial [Priestia flexa]|uniref:hypothetical protein n=1 Tax=Priestia flexa TaxID=86664 RepID=UPI001C92E0C8
TIKNEKSLRLTRTLQVSRQSEQKTQVAFTCVFCWEGNYPFNLIENLNLLLWDCQAVFYLLY